MKLLVFLAIAITSACITAARAPAAIRPTLPSDAELQKLIVGTWKVDFPPTGSAVHYGYETYAGNGTFKFLEAVQEGKAPERLVGKVSGTWSVQGGFIVAKVAAANYSRLIGHVDKIRIESASPEGFVLLGHTGSRARRRARLPTEMESGMIEVPKVFTVEEAAQVLRYAVKPAYSSEALLRRATGIGLFELRFDYDTGRLKAIDIVKSTGSDRLDHDAINALKDWKAKPRSIRVMRISIGFKMHGHF